MAQTVKFSHILSLADITVGFAMPSYTVNESVGDAMLTVTAQGEFPSASLQSQLTVPVEAVVLVYTDDITAEGVCERERERERDYICTG